MSALCAFTISACASAPAPPTEIVVVVDSDLATPNEIDHVEITVRRDTTGAMMLSQQGAAYDNGTRTLPLTVGLLYTGGDLGPLLVTSRALLGGANGTVVVEQTARVFFERGRRMLLRMHLVRSCVASRISCSTNQTCVDGDCTGIDRDILPWVPLDGGGLEISDAGQRDGRTDPDASDDGGSDAGLDASVDAAVDAQTDEDSGQAPDASDEADTGPTCIAMPEVCNDQDDDCDGRIDEGFDKESIEHCGVCDNACPTNLPNARSICDEGACAIECIPNTDDCDDNPSNGCETTLTSPTACGSCGISCDGATPFCGFDGLGLSCVGACGVLTLCDGTSCVDTDNDPLHCGGCSPCAAQSNASPSCVSGGCEYGCFSGYASCTDGDNNNGCETNLRTDPAHCNACDNACADQPNSSPRCVSGNCDIACDNGYSDCDNTITNGCEIHTNADPDNCGSCGNMCPARTNAARTCSGGNCGFTCNPGRGNCDNNAANGCETNTNTNGNHCGACGTRCPALQGCCNGSCRLLSLGC